MAAEPMLNDANLEALCNVLGDTGTGLTGSEIGRYLRDCGIADPLPGMTKRVRLLEAVRSKQNADRCASLSPGRSERAVSPRASRPERDLAQRSSRGAESRE